MGRTRPKVPLPAGKSRFFGVSSAGSVLLVCVPVNLDKSWYRPNCLPLQRTTVDTSPPGGDIGRKDRRVVKAIALLLQRRDSRCWHTFDVGTSRT